MEALKLALSMYGITEVSGPQYNKQILDIVNKGLAAYGLTAKDDGEYPWCAIYMSYLLNETGQWNNKWIIRARDFLKEFPPAPGLIIGKTMSIFWRESPTSGKAHIGLDIAERDGSTYILAGNQMNTINIMAFTNQRKLGRVQFIP